MIGEGGRGALRLQGWFVKLALGWGGGPCTSAPPPTQAVFPIAPLYLPSGGRLHPFIAQDGGASPLPPFLPKEGHYDPVIPQEPPPTHGGGSL